MQAMAMGLPTIATAWSGHTHYMTDDNSFLVPVSNMSKAFPHEPHVRR